MGFFFFSYYFIHRRRNAQLAWAGLWGGLVLGWLNVMLAVLLVLVIFMFFGGLAWLAALNS